MTYGQNMEAGGVAELKIDRLHYMGNQKYGFGGLLNHGSVLNVGPVANGAGGTPLTSRPKRRRRFWRTSTKFCAASEFSTGLAIMPNRVLVSQRIMSALSIPIAPLPGCRF